jgi:hypothetical protein
MPSGYEKSPDYGGPEPTIRGVVLGVLAFIAVAAIGMLLAGGWL